MFWPRTLRIFPSVDAARAVPVSDARAAATAIQRNVFPILLSPSHGRGSPLRTDYARPAPQKSPEIGMRRDIRRRSARWIVHKNCARVLIEINAMATSRQSRARGRGARGG